MIQRIQSLWLLLAAIVMFIGTRLPFAVAKNTESGQIEPVMVNEYLIAYLLAIFLSLGTLVIIFLFKRRSNQRRLIWLGILSSILFIVLMYFKVEEYRNIDNIHSASFKIGAAFPVLYIIFMTLAYSGVKRDDKLVKSVDRLR